MSRSSRRTLVSHKLRPFNTGDPALDKHLDEQHRDHTAQVFSKLAYFDKYTQDQELTEAETAAGVTPTDFTVPSHLSAGVVLPERYGGANGGVVLNDTPHLNALKVADAIGDGVVQYGPGIWKFASPVVNGATGYGRRVVGIGRCEWDLSSVSTSSDGVTLIANLFTLYTDQPQFDNIQLNCNGGCRDGLVLTVGNNALIRNVRIIAPSRDGYVEAPTGTNWIEKGEADVLVRFAGRNAFRFELLGTAGQNPFINERHYYLECRGVAAITAGGAAVRITGSAGLGGAAKFADNVFARTVFDAIYNIAGPVPSTSPVVLDTVIVENATIRSPAWENTGTGGNPGAGPEVKVSSGTWAGLRIEAANWNSFWGDGTIDAAITSLSLDDYSFHRSALRGPAIINTTAGTIGSKVIGNTTADTQPDFAAIRTGAAVNSLGQGASYLAGNDTTATYYLIQEYSGEVVFYTFSGGAWGERLRILTTGEIRYAKALVALGGGAAPTLGTIGGSGPATATQNSWVQIKDSTGVSVWIPAWK